jgi:hypothetical protein
MSDEPKIPEEQAAAPEAPAPEPEAAAEPRAQWQYKQEFAIIGHMRTIINETIKTTRLEIDRQRKKLRKLTYGA